MQADPGNIATNAAAATAKPCYKIEVLWDASWVDETANTVLGGKCSNQLVDPFEGLGSMGAAPIGRATLVVDNYNGRFSEARAGSPAALYGIYGKPIRLSAGYVHGGTPEYVRIWTGRIMDVTESERSTKARIECHDMGSVPMQQKHSTLMYEGQRTDAWIELLADLAGVADRSLERGLTVLPYCYLDDDFALDEIRRVAAAEGGVTFFDVLGRLRFWNAAHWCNASSVATFTVGGFGELEPRRAYDGIYNVVAVEYQPRLAGLVAQVYGLERTVAIPANGSKTLKLRVSQPLLRYTGYEMSACSAGGVDMTAQVTTWPAGPQAAASWEIIFSNADTRQAAFLTRFDVYGVPIEGRPAEEYQVDESMGAVPRRKPVRGNWYVQTEAQARLIGNIWSQRLKAVRLSMMLRGAPGNPLLELGDVVTVTATRTGINRQAIVTSLEHRPGKSYTMDIGLADFTDFYAYSNYFRVGTSALNSGRLFT